MHLYATEVKSNGLIMFSFYFNFSKWFIQFCLCENACINSNIELNLYLS